MLLGALVEDEYQSSDSEDGTEADDGGLYQGMSYHPNPRTQYHSRRDIVTLANQDHRTLANRLLRWPRFLLLSKMNCGLANMARILGRGIALLDSDLRSYSCRRYINSTGCIVVADGKVHPFTSEDSTDPLE